MTSVHISQPLPPGQEMIFTSLVRKARVFTNLILDEQLSYPEMGAIVGPAGIGKSIIAHYCVRDIASRSQTGLPISVLVEVRPRSTPKAFAVDFAGTLSDRISGVTIYAVSDELVDLITRNGLKLLVVDEADRLSADTLEVLRHIHDRTGCRIVLFGLPSLLSLINSQQKFASRIARRMHLEPLKTQEVLDVVLPNLAFPTWRYSANDADDRSLGAHIWDIATPSLRNLRNLLQAADQVARQKGTDAITRQIIDAVIRENQSPAQRQAAGEANRVPDPDTFEGESELRNAGKQARKMKG